MRPRRGREHVVVGRAHDGAVSSMVITTSAPVAASAAVSPGTTPLARAVSHGGGGPGRSRAPCRRSLTRFAAIGPPMFPGRSSPRHSLVASSQLSLEARGDRTAQDDAHDLVGALEDPARAGRAMIFQAVLGEVAVAAITVAALDRRR